MMFCLGPSMTIDTACSSGLFCLESAVNAIREGRCERALVGASNLLLKMENSVQFMNLKMLSPDGACKSFDSSGKMQQNNYDMQLELQ